MLDVMGAGGVLAALQEQAGGFEVFIHSIHTQHTQPGSTLSIHTQHTHTASTARVNTQHTRSAFVRTRPTMCFLGIYLHLVSANLFHLIVCVQHV